METIREANSNYENGQEKQGMAGERSPKRFDFRRREARLSERGRQLRVEALRVENELILLLRQEWSLIHDYSIQMLQYLELQLTCDIMVLFISYSSFYNILSPLPIVLLLVISLK